MSKHIISEAIQQVHHVQDIAEKAKTEEEVDKLFTEAMVEFFQTVEPYLDSVYQRALKPEEIRKNLDLMVQQKRGEIEVGPEALEMMVKVKTIFEFIHLFNALMNNSRNESEAAFYEYFNRSKLPQEDFEQIFKEMQDFASVVDAF